MGKQEEGHLWDDSALITAFDDAMSTYKKMHSKGPNEGSAKGEKLVIANAVDESEEAIRKQEGADEQTKDVLKATVDMGDSSNLSEVIEDQYVDSHVPVPYSQDAQAIQNDYSYSQGAEDYTKLLNQYYELEEKRQKILEQLHQFGGGNYQYSAEASGSGVQWGTVSSCEQNAVPTGQPSNTAVGGSCCGCTCPCVMIACTSCPACILDGSFAGITCDEACLATSHGKPISLEDGKIVKTAMGTAERALSTMKMKVYGDHNISEEKKIEKEEAEMTESSSSETDISAVLNAWYSAGFYTGKYIVEQSLAKKRQS